MICAGVGLSGTLGTLMPAAQRMPMMMSLSVPPHLPSTRTGRISVFQPVPAIPSALLVSAAIRLDTRVPCQELFTWSMPGAGAGRDVERCAVTPPPSRSRRDRWHRIAAIAVVRERRVRDEIEAVEQLASLRHPQQVRVLRSARRYR